MSPLKTTVSGTSLGLIRSALFLFCSVFFVGPNAKKKSGVLGGANNGGYDDEHGSYIQVPHDHIAYRYEVLKVIGKGSFGQVRLHPAPQLALQPVLDLCSNVSVSVIILHLVLVLLIFVVVGQF